MLMGEFTSSEEKTSKFKVRTTQFWSQVPVDVVSDVSKDTSLLSGSGSLQMVAVKYKEPCNADFSTC